MSIVHFYLFSLIITKPNLSKRLKFIERPISASEHHGIETIDLTNLSLKAKKLEMSNKNLRKSSNLSEENDEFPFIEELLAASETTGLAERVGRHRNQNADDNSPFFSPNKETFILDNTNLFSNRC